MSVVKRKNSAVMNRGKMLAGAAQFAANLTPYGKYYNVAKGVYNAASAGAKFFRGGKRKASTSSLYNKFAGTKRVKTGSRKWEGTSTGVYAGKFRKARKVKNTFFTECLRTGYKENIEEFGRVEDPNTVYLGHSTKHELEMAVVFTGCFIRNLFRKAGMEIANRREELGLFSFNNSSGFKIEYVVQNPQTGQQLLNSEYVIADNQTLSTIVANMSAMTGQIGNFIRNTDQLEPYKLTLYSLDRDVVDLNLNWRMAAQINMSHQYVNLMVKSTLVVQNRTAGATAGATDKGSDRVDNQPLVGKLYEFSQASPRLAQKNNPNGERLGRVPQAGLSLVRAAQLGSADFENSPDPKIWTNVSKTSNIILQPGTMKENSIVHMFKGKIMTVLRRIRSSQSTGVGPAAEFVGGAGKFVYMQFEEKLRTTSSNPVTVQYERKYEIGMIMKKTKTPALQPGLLVNEVNNLA